jgi:hypothetical protein
MNLTKDSSIFHHAIHSVSSGGFLKKTRLYSGFKKHAKKSVKQENLSLFMNSILLKGKMREDT